MLHKSTSRCKILRTQVVGEDRGFLGTVVLSLPDDPCSSDSSLLADLGSDAEHMVVYWSDAGKLHDGDAGARVGCLGAGVVWRERGPTGMEQWRSSEFPLGRDTSTSGDAELYGVAAAMKIVAQHVWSGNGHIHRARIFTDHNDILKAIDNPKLGMPLGPFTSTRPAIWDLYGNADWLISVGVQVELVWVKGHSKSRGNKRADKAARRTVQRQANFSAYAAYGHDKGAKTKAPNEFEEMGWLWREEWLWRADKRSLLRGRKALGVEEKMDRPDDEEADMDTTGDVTDNEDVEVDMSE